ncbi:MAG: winged helix-turn-helix domain-containing protein, partial [Nitriliruptoraceae bacterium]
MRPEMPPEPEPQQARDVVAFGQEIGRALSDGRIVGRAEPFAKVFPSSRPVKRVVGVTAWVILEDIALDASLDAEGRLVAGTSVRRIAANLGLAKNTVSRHLARLREHGFVLHEEVREPTAGRFETARYVLDPSAALERFTVTPTVNGVSDKGKGPDEPTDGPCPNSWDAAVGTCPSFCDTGPCPKNCDTAQSGQVSPDQPVSQFSVSPELGHNREQPAAGQQQQQTSRAGAREISRPDPGDPSPDDGALARRLCELGVDESTAQQLLVAHPVKVVRDALDAVAGVDAT